MKRKINIWIIVLLFTMILLSCIGVVGYDTDTYRYNETYRTCRVCNGYGRITRIYNFPYRRMVVERCNYCYGKGYIVGYYYPKHRQNPPHKPPINRRR